MLKIFETEEMKNTLQYGRKKKKNHTKKGKTRSETDLKQRQSKNNNVSEYTELMKDTDNETKKSKIKFIKQQARNLKLVSFQICSVIL